MSICIFALMLVFQSFIFRPIAEHFSIEFDPNIPKSISLAGFWLLVVLSIYALALRAIDKISSLEATLYVLITISLPLAWFIYFITGWSHDRPH